MSFSERCRFGNGTTNVILAGTANVVPVFQYDVVPLRVLNCAISGIIANTDRIIMTEELSVNRDLQKERRNASFNPNHVTGQLYGKEGMNLRRDAFRKVADEPAFKIAEKFPTMPRDDVFNESTRIYTVMLQRLAEYDYSGMTAEQIMSVRSWYIEAAVIDSFPFSVHSSMFLPTIKGQGTEEQIARFLPGAESHELIGTYAQTELGHGTFIRGLETTSTYDKQKQEFVIHSPTVTSIKYWPGGLGKTSNYAVVMARLIIDGKEYGLNPFMCQLRDLGTHLPLPGVELGDINCKFGYDEVDNGYLKFDHYRIPRTNMLMRFAQVSPEGKFTRQAVPQTAYLTMTYVRMGIVFGAANMLSKAATIATRYSAVRHQTANSKGVEPQILDYQTQQMKLFPAISLSYALYFTAFTVRRIYVDIMAAVQSGDTSRLPEIHSLTSGLKAFSTEASIELIETCRRSCGGHGYSHASGIPRLYQRALPACTYEGENTVMYLQCARSLVKFLKKAQTGEVLPATLKFLTESPTVPSKLKFAKSFNLPLYLMAFKVNVLRSILQVTSELSSSSKSMDSETAWNHHSVELANAAKLYSVYLTALFFVDGLTSREWDANAKAVMDKVCEFYLVNSILACSGSFIQNDVVSPQQMNGLMSRRVELLSALRPDAVTLVDAFDHPDHILSSCLGRYDGNVYEALYEYAKSSTLNTHQVHPSYHKYIKPLQQALQAKL